MFAVHNVLFPLREYSRWMNAWHFCVYMLRRPTCFTVSTAIFRLADQSKKSKKNVHYATFGLIWWNELVLVCVCWCGCVCVCGYVCVKVLKSGWHNVKFMLFFDWYYRPDTIGSCSQNFCIYACSQHATRTETATRDRASMISTQRRIFVIACNNEPICVFRYRFIKADINRTSM